MRILLAPLMGLGLLAQAPAARPLPPTPPAAVESELKVGAATLHYWSQGQGSPVVLLSGGPGFASYLQPVMAALAPEHRCILLDQRGTGKSVVVPMDTSTINVALLVEDLEALRRHLGFARWTVLGHSWGGMLGMAYAGAHPDSIQSLVLVDSGGMTLDFAGPFDDNLHGRLLPSDLDAEAFWRAPEQKKADPDHAGAEALVAILPGYFYDRRKALALMPTLLAPGFFSRPMSGLLWKDLGAHWDVQPGMKAFTRPTLILQGRQDPIDEATAFGIRDACRSSRLVFIEKCGHFPWLEQPEETYKALGAFLKETAP